MKKIAVILAGGTGGRLWPESTELLPKQFRSFISDLPMVYDTYKLLNSHFNSEDIYIITFKKYEDLVRSTIRSIPDENILLEPFGRNTAPAIALTNLLLQNKYDTKDVITFFPSDHIIEDEDNYLRSVELAIDSALFTNGIVSVGIEPLSPNNQLGYIQYADNTIEKEELFNNGLRKAKVFAEKPDVDTASRFIESGDFVWNTGIFSVQMGVLKSEIKEHLPLLSTLMEKIEDKFGTTEFEENLNYVYKQVNSISIDNGLLEPSKLLYIIKSKFGWSDLGTWDEFYNHCRKDEFNNVLKGDVVALKTNNCLVKSSDKLIAVTDVEDLIIIESENAIFISKRGCSENVKDLIHHIRARELNKMIK